MSTTAAALGGNGRAARKRPAWLRYWPLLPISVFLLVFFVYPTVQLLGLSGFNMRNQPSLVNYERLVHTDLYIRILLITLKISGWTTVFAVLGGYPVAYLLATMRRSRRNGLLIWVLMPFWTSFLVRTFAWIILLGRNGAVNDFVQALGFSGQRLNLIYNFTGVMVGMVHALMPLGVLTMLAVMDNIDTNLPRAASTLGARGGQAFWRVYFPLSVPGVASGALLIFITALGFFITPALLGGRMQTMLVQVIITDIQQLLNWPFAGALSMLLLVAVLVIFWIYDRLLGLSTISGEVSAGRSAEERGLIGRLGTWLGTLFVAGMGNACAAVGKGIDRVLPQRPDRPRRTTGKRLLWLAAILVVTFLAVPTFFVVPVSFTKASYLGWPPQGFSLEWYRRVIHSPFWADAAWRSLVVATFTGIISMLLGVPAAFVMSRERVRARTAVFAFLISPMIIPRIIIAVGLFFLYSKIALVGTMTGLVLGHTVIAMPYVVVTVMALMKNYDFRLDQAAATLGANRMRTLWHVTFPIIRGGLVAAFMFAFIISIDELTVALFVTGGAFTTLPKHMWDSALLQVSPTLAAVSTLMLLFMSILILISEYMRRRSNRRLESS